MLLSWGAGSCTRSSPPEGEQRARRCRRPGRSEPGQQSLVHVDKPEQSHEGIDGPALHIIMRSGVKREQGSGSTTDTIILNYCKPLLYARPMLWYISNCKTFVYKLMGRRVGREFWKWSGVYEKNMTDRPNRHVVCAGALGLVKPVQ